MRKRWCSTNLLVWVKLGYPLNFNFLGIPLPGKSKCMEEKEKERIMPNLVATTSALAKSQFLITMYRYQVLGGEEVEGEFFMLESIILRIQPMIYSLVYILRILHNITSLRFINFLFIPPRIMDNSNFIFSGFYGIVIDF